MSPLGSFPVITTGNSANYMMVNDPAYNAIYTRNANAATIADVKSALKDANEYVARQHYVVSLLQPMHF